MTSGFPKPRRLDADPVLSAGDIRLRVPVSSDYDYLQSLFTDPRVTVGWRLRGGTVPPDQFVQHLWQGVLAQFVVCRKRSGERIGLVSAYNADLRNGCVWLAIIFTPEYSLRGWPFIAAGLLQDYLFELWPLRKLYFEVLEFNFVKIASGEGRWFEVEGCLRDYEFHDGRYWHKYLLGFTREKWLALRGDSA